MKWKHLANGENIANKEGGEEVSAIQLGGKVKPADVIWVKIHKDSWWPAQVNVELCFYLLTLPNSFLVKYNNGSVVLIYIIGSFRFDGNST